MVAYVAAPHAGYLKFFRAYQGSVLYIFGEDLIKKFKPLYRHLPGVTSEEARQMIRSLGIFSDVHILTLANIPIINDHLIVMPDEDVSHAVAEEYFAGKDVTFDGRWRLRWDWGTSAAFRRPEGERLISVDELDQEFMRSAFRAAERSPDWWRQIASGLARDGRMLLWAHNRHLPNEQSAYLYGDPRSSFDPGQGIDVSAAFHSEAGIVAEAARRGLSMEGCDLYVTTFPCPPCAYLVAHSGIKRLYYCDGYSLVAGAETLQSKDVEIIRVQMS
ncbi:MAG: zinc-binding CMP/dCMP deaminase, dCMP deaminase [Parcubacteria group bacterium]|nr:zinc-binding CMP/dCMP deaminase, dCMP deaminase [Parcubacteria group bacterium]